MFTKKLWLMPKSILLDLNIYGKLNLREIFKGILFRMHTGCPWRDFFVLAQNLTFVLIQLSGFSF